MGSPIRKSADITDMCSSPRLIAACHVLLRLLMPRHSPCALFSLTSSRVLLILLLELCRHLQLFLEIVIVTLTCACARRCFHNYIYRLFPLPRVPNDNLTLSGISDIVLLAHQYTTSLICCLALLVIFSLFSFQGTSGLSSPYEATAS